MYDMTCNYISYESDMSYKLYKGWNLEIVVKTKPTGKYFKSDTLYKFIPYFN